MLFRALTLRICRVRTEENEHPVSNGLQDDRVIPPSRYTDILELIGDLLASEAEDSVADSGDNARQSASIPTARISAALDLTMRMNESVENRATLQNMMKALLGVSSWVLRDNAARTFASLVESKDALDVVSELACTSNVSANVEHGRLLCTRHVFAKASSKGLTVHLGSYVSIANAMLNTPRTQPRTAMAMSAMVDFVNDLLVAAWRLGRKIEINYDFHEALTGLLKPSAGVAPAVNNTLLHVSTREPLATAMLLSLGMSKRLPASDLSNTMSRLLEIDLNAGCNTSEKVQFALNEETAPTMFDLYMDLLSGRHPEKVVAIVMNNLALMLENVAGRRAFETKTLGRFFDFRVDLAKVSRELFNSWLRLEGGLLGLYYSLRANQGLAASIPTRLSHWTLAVREGLDDLDPSTRLIAARSLAALGPAMTEGANDPTHLYSALLLLYDTLNDDDEEIRDVGAVTVSSLAAACENDFSRALCPLAAAKWLINYLTNHFHHSDQLVASGVERLLAQSPSQITRSVFTPLRTQLESALGNNDDRIFAEEEQNLYIDHVREVEVWTDVLKKTAPAVHVRLFVGLRNWAVDAFDCLDDYRRDLPGPFGLASRPEVYILVSRARAASDVASSWAQELGMTDRTLGEIHQQMKELEI